MVRSSNKSSFFVKFNFCGNIRFLSLLLPIQYFGLSLLKPVPLLFPTPGLGLLYRSLEAQNKNPLQLAQNYIWNLQEDIQERLQNLFFHVSFYLLKGCILQNKKNIVRASPCIEIYWLSIYILCSFLRKDNDKRKEQSYWLLHTIYWKFFGRVDILKINSGRYLRQANNRHKDK